MKKYLKYFLICIISILIFSFFNTVNAYYKADDEKGYISLDFENKNELPSLFRTSLNLKEIENDNINASGLDTLNISGSSEFTKLSLIKLKEAINTSYPLYIIDLRQESHGFINGNAISLFNKGNKINAGIPLNTVIKRENLFLQSIPLKRPIYLDIDKYKIVPESIENEETIAKNNNLIYFRIPVTDNERPTDEMVDRFLKFTKSLPKDKWLHFHCKEGYGRTTTFMILYDIINNYKDVSFSDIIARQSTLASIDLLRFDKNDNRYIFLENFYKYASETNLNSSWQEWVKANNIESFTLIDEIK